jgi:hypothetical protein
MNIALKIEAFPGFGNEMLYKLKKFLQKTCLHRWNRNPLEEELLKVRKREQLGASLSVPPS